MAKTFSQTLLASLSKPVTGQKRWVSGSGWWPGSSSKPVSVDSALQVSTVWACVRLISETIATLPLGIYKRKNDGGRQIDPSFRVHDLISNSPNQRMTAVNFWEAVVASMLFKGNAYIEIKRLKDLPVSLNLLQADNVKWLEEESSWVYTEKNKKRYIAFSNLMHIPAFSLDGINGLSPLRYGAVVIGSAISADKAASSTFQNGLMPTVAFSVNRVLTKEQRDDFREYVEKLSGAMNAGRSPVLESGVEAKPIGIDPADAQLLESRGWSVEEICRFFRVPPWMVGHTEKSTSWGTGIEQQMIGFLTFTLAPWLERIEQAINKNLLTIVQRQTHYAEFALEGLLRADSQARADFYAKMTTNGIYTRDDCRVKENLPREGGNASKLTVQMNMTTLDKLGAQNDEQAAKAALKSWLSASED
ncbi:portal protein [Thiopseudomonas alkaliphila]|uniref:Portal protein n=1 Tax=Thiopseudomonas alkaliphila TaxID=1697053 RepID=A0A0K1XH09_9GAMM|nr:phage portal protein [Thiopseudomonas alkaliphila]AKX52028.1 portal protein [Thiopseudomonas alkaliphila]AKX60467.1 portal protein [Thiopseudomonas alkaliphila]